MHGSAQQTLTDCLCCSLFFSYQIHFTAMSTLNNNFFFHFLDFFCECFLGFFWPVYRFCFRNQLLLMSVVFSTTKMLYFFMNITHIEKGVFFVTVFRYFFNECNFLYYKDALFSLLAIFLLGITHIEKGRFFVTFPFYFM